MNLTVKGRTKEDNQKINDLINSSDFQFYGEFNSAEGFFTFQVEDESEADNIEFEMSGYFETEEISARFELEY